MVLYLDALETGGWILRKSDPQDRRAHVVQLTPEGARKFAQLGPRMLAAQNRFLVPLSKQEITNLTEMLKRLAGVHQIDGDHQVAAASGGAAG